MRLVFVGDGERDAAMNPALVANITGKRIDASATAWPRLNAAGRGYDRKLLFALRQAREQGAEGLVATVDRDRSPGRDRLREMIAARMKDRETAPPLPAALGCADPHAEVWLLDDPLAVREVLGLAAAVEVPNIRRSEYPKTDLERLHRASRRAYAPILTILVEISQTLRVERPAHAAETGFRAFVNEVRDEFRE